VENVGAVCRNIGPSQMRLRLVGGLLLAVVAIGLGACAWWVGQPWFVRALVAFPAYFAVLCFLEVRYRTCVVLAELGKQNLDQGAQTVGDARLARELRSVARRLYWQALLVASVLTGGYLAVTLACACASG
jgi:hypothetical protein